MIDRDKVIDALNRCTLQGRHSGKRHQEACAACLYRRDRKCNFTALMKDALELLKEQEAVKPIEPIYQGDDSYVCENCGETVGWEEIECYGIGKIRYKYCPGCGRAVKWE